MQLSNSRGQSLIQVMVAMAVSSIFLAAMVAMQTNQTRENQSLKEKVSAIDLTRTVTSSLSSACSLLITKPNNEVVPGSFTFDTATAVYPFTIDIKSIPSSPTVDIVSLTNPQASSLVNSLKILTVGGIKIQVTSATTGNLLVNFDQNSLIRAIPNLIFPITLQSTTAGTNETITGCASAGGASDACWTLAGTDLYQSCIATNVGIGTTTPLTTLHVQGQVLGGWVAASTANIDWSLGNVQRTGVAPTTLNFVPGTMFDGGSYTLIIAGAFGGVYTLGTAGDITTWRCSPTCMSNQITTTGHTVLTILKAGTTGYVAWSSGF